NFATHAMCTAKNTAPTCAAAGPAAATGAAPAAASPAANPSAPAAATGAAPASAVLPCLLDIGELMLVAGADVSLVERTLDRMGRAYGARKMHAFVITAVIMVTMTNPDGSEVTLTRRIDTKGETNFGKLEKLNRLAEECCAHPVPRDELSRRTSAIAREPFPRRALYAGGVLAAGSFAMFFGGTLLDGVISAVFAVLICWLMERLKPLSPNNIVFNFAAALVAGLGIGMTARVVPGVSVDMIMIGDIMLLIPGIAMTNAARDMLAGDTVTGVMRLVESLLWATALALGFMAALWLTDASALAAAVRSTDPLADAIIQLVVSLPASAGFALLFNLRGPLVVPASVGGVLSWGIYLACGQVIEGIFFPCLIASAFSAVYAELLARHYRAPGALFFIIAVIPLVPGRGLFYTMNAAVRADWAAFSDFALLTLQFALGIAVGISVVWAVREVMRRFEEARRA
uniref:threonine/serine ThrE exporter family protein n=1 Tax=Adlercreutzia sp. ZJ473 TaxID=2722822 RepID=UPI001554017E